MSGEPLRDRQNRLGRGFSALMPGAPSPAAEATRTGVLQAAIEDVLPDRAQPRRHFDESALEELAASIRAKGVIQPILVRRDGGKYRIVAGERRWRAAQRAGLQSLPVLVKDVTEHQAFELALIENIQRQDLSPSRKPRPIAASSRSTSSPRKPAPSASARIAPPSPTR